MGQLLLTIPQNTKLELDIKSIKRADLILKPAQSPKKNLETITLDFPYDLDDVDENESVGIWANRKESAEEIARTIRDKNNGKI
jgi:hypothetical protein